MPDVKENVISFTGVLSWLIRVPRQASPFLPHHSTCISSEAEYVIDDNLPIEDHASINECSLARTSKLALQVHL